LGPELVAHVRAAQERGELRADLPAEKLAGFVSLVANGVALQTGSGEPIRDVDTLVELVRAAIEPGARSRDRARAGMPSRTRA
ncbi:MAG: hypothetical protein R6W48_01330, partial [Gaiellaceae bacterium]